MPAITVQSIELSEIQKKVLAKKYVEIFSEITNVPKDRVYIFFDGYELNNVGTAGIRFSDKPSKAWSKFTEEDWIDILPTHKCGGFRYQQPKLLMKAKSDKVSCAGRCPALCPVSGTFF